jgi:NADH dehydrogenase
MRIFLAGGTGFVGEHVLDALRTAGHTIRVLVHNAMPLHGEGVEPVKGEVTDPASFRDGLEGCQAVINLVGIIREHPGRGVTFQRLHVQASRVLVEEARKSGIERYLHMSALGSRPGAVSAYHRSKWEGEEAVRHSGLNHTIFRPSVIFGPRDDFINRLAGYVRSFPAMPVMGDGAYRLQPVSADDVGKCFALALEKRETAGQAYELCGQDRVSYLELVALIGECLGRTPRTVHFPLGLMKGIVPLLQGLPGFPLTMDQLQMLLEESICDGSWRKVFGFEPLGLREGIARYLRP